MDSTIPEGAPKNPYHDYVQDYANSDRNYGFADYVRPGSYSWIPIPEQMKVKFTNSITNVQRLLLPTIQGLRNQRNIGQLQNRIYRKLKVYQEEYNKCHLDCRNQTQVYQCGDIFLHRLNVEIPEHIKKVLDEY